MLDDLVVAEGEVVPVPHLHAAGDEGVCAVVEEEDGVDDEY